MDSPGRQKAKLGASPKPQGPTAQGVKSVQTDRASAGRSRQCGDAPQWTETQKGCRPSSPGKGSQMLQSLAKAGGTKPLPQFLEEKARGQERKRQQNITARHRHRKYPKGLTQAKPHINRTNKIVKGVFPKWQVFMHHLPYACLIYLLNIFH